MARYGTFPYSEQKYGASSLTTNLWALEVDWDDDNIFSGRNEASRLIKLQTKRGNDYYLSANGHGFDTIKTGSAIVTLDNYDGLYDPYNSSSELYGFLEPGKKVRISIKTGSVGTKYWVITGILQDIQSLSWRDTVDLVIDDCWRWLADRDANTELYTDVKANEAIEHVLDAVSWPEIWGSNLDTGPDTIPYWWATGKKAKSEIEDLANSGLGQIFVANDGTLKYYSRQRTDDPVLVLSESILQKGIAIPQPWEFKRNIIKVQTHPRKLQSSQAIWTLQETPQIITGESITLWAEHTYDGVQVPAINVVTPVDNTDYTANEQEDGEGIDYTTDISVTITKFSNVSKIVYTNTGTANIHLTFAQLRGQPINAPDASIIVVEGSDAESYPRTLEIDMPWQQNYNTGNDLATLLEDFLGSPQIFPTVFIRNRPDIQFAVDLNDKVSMSLDTWGIDKNFRVGKIRHTFMNENGQDVLTELKLFPIYVPPVDTYWYLGTNTLGVDTYLGV